MDTLKKAKIPIRIREKLWTRDFITICLVNFTLAFGFQMLAPGFPLFVINELGGNEAISGLLVGIFSITALIIRPLAGWFLDNKGRRPILFLGLILILSMLISYKLTTSITLLIAWRMIHGLGWGMASTSIGTHACDFLPQERFTEGMGFFGATNTVALALSPALGLWVIGRSGFSSMLNISLACTFLCLLLTFQLRSHKIEPPQKLSLKSLKLFSASALPSSILQFFASLPYGAVAAFIAKFIQQLGLGSGGFYFTVLAISLFSVRAFAGRLADKKGDDLVMVPGFILLILGVAVLIFAKTMPLIVASAILYGLGMGLSLPSTQAIAMRGVPEGEMGAANSTFFSSSDIGIGGGSIFAGFLLKYFGYPVMFAFAVVAGIISLILYYYWIRRLPANQAHRQQVRDRSMIKLVKEDSI